MAVRDTVTDEASTSEADSLAPAVTRAALILDVLAETAGEPAGPSELARRLGLPKSSIANICGALADAGLVRRVGTGFALGRRLAELGGAYLVTVDQVQEFYEASRVLPTGSEETVQFAVLDGLEVTYLARHDGRQPVRLTSGHRTAPPGILDGHRQGGPGLARRRRTGAPAGRHHDAAAADAAGRIDRSTSCSRTSHEIRRRGYAIDDEETMEGVVCYGVVVPSRQPGEGPNAASITLLKVRATPERVPGLIEDLQLAGRRAVRPVAAQLRSGQSGSRESVDAAGCPAEDGGLFGRAEARRQLSSRSRRRHRYDAASRQTGQSEPNSSRSGPKAARATSTDGASSSTRPRGPVRLGHETGELAPDVGPRGKRAEAALPRSQHPVTERRLGQVVEHEP